MYYNRTLSEGFAELLKKDGKLRWLFDFVKKREDLDFLIGKNKTNEWISVYRGLSRMVTIKKTRNPEIIKIDGAKAYMRISPFLYGEKEVSHNFKDELEYLLNRLAVDPQFYGFYNNKKEGYYQNILSRKHGICGNKDDDFVVIDKEAVVGFSGGNAQRNNHLGNFQQKYKVLLKDLSARDPKRYGSNLEKRPIGNELDFFALDSEGNILLIEYKHGRNTSGLFFTPIQVGMYYDIFANFPRKKLETAVFEMLKQKQEIGLINPYWKTPTTIKEIIPVLIFSDFNYNGTAKIKFDDVFQIAREPKHFGECFLENLKAYNFTEENGLSKW